MTEGRDPASMIEAAQQAVGDEDYPAAERLLREAAAIQEATLGASHPDLATTLNNLAFVCEQTNQTAEAERGYRRAHAIAVASLSPGHPLIATSLKNLVDFCAANDIPIWTPRAAPIEDEPLDDDFEGESPLENTDVEAQPGDADVELSREHASVEFARQDVDGDLSREDAHVEFSSEAAAIPPAVIEVALDKGREPATASRVPLLMMAGAALVVAAILAFVFVRQGARTETSEVSRAVAPDRTATVPPAPAAAVTPASVTSAPVTPAPAKTTNPVPPRAEPAVTAKPRRETAAANVPVTVLNAQLCSALSRNGSPDWRCTPASGDLRPGRYTFYTRLLTTAATMVEHRWYFQGRAHQTMRLRVTASPGNGFRTFSATTVSPERAGDWKVELRAPDGRVLHEEEFVVRQTEGTRAR